MSGDRVYKVAKRFDISSEALVKLLEEIGHSVNSHMSTIEDDVVSLVSEKLAEEKEAARRKDEKKKKFGSGKFKPRFDDEVVGKSEKHDKAGRKVKKKKTGVADGLEVKTVKSEVWKKDESADADKLTTGKKKKKKKKKKVVNQKIIAENIKKTLAKMETGTAVRKRKRKKVVSPDEVVEEQNENTVKVMEFISLAELSDLIDVPANKLISTCIELGLMVTVNQRLDFETISLICDEFGFSAVQDDEYGQEILKKEKIKFEMGDRSDVRERPPIVTVMGHVDHGKTTLLDHIRKTRVVSGEAGGITQHIGAYKVITESGPICFLDTPGHEAFTSMRARGAQVTDIVVLVIAADDSIQPQTVEAINHAKAGNVPIIVAVNKIDLPQANPAKVKQELMNHNILIEDFGGEVLCTEISAKTGDGMDRLMELILLQAEVMELEANYSGPAQGVVVESKLDRGMGAVATVLITAGQLAVGDPFICGLVSGKVRAMRNERGIDIKDAEPGTPVQILGFDGVPQAGDNFHSVEEEREAKDISNIRQRLKREQDFSRHRKLTLGQLFDRIEAGVVLNLNLIIKGDVDGSVEALSDSLEKLTTAEVKVLVIHRAVGAITENDVILASASNAIIIGFHVRADLKARDAAQREGVDIRLYRVIYEVVDDVKNAMEGLLGSEQREKLMATIEVREVYKLSRYGTIAGCMVVDGKVERNHKVRLNREGMVVWEGSIDSLKRFKEDVREVNTGFECGIKLENYSDIKVGDVIESYTTEEVKRHLGGAIAR